MRGYPRLSAAIFENGRHDSEYTHHMLLYMLNNSMENRSLIEAYNLPLGSLVRPLAHRMSKVKLDLCESPRSHTFKREYMINRKSSYLSLRYDPDQANP